MPFPFSSKTIGALARVIPKCYSDTDIGTLILEAQADPWEPESWSSKQARIQHLLKTMRADSTDESRRAALDVARLVLQHGAPSDEWSEGAPWFPELRQSLTADGWEYDIETTRLVPTIPNVDMAEQSRRVSEQLRGLSCDTPSGHYDQAVDAFGRGNWASANAQLRSTLEGVVPFVAEQLSGDRPSNVKSALQKLQASNKLVGGEFSYADGLWQMCQSNGSHLGLSDAEEARFRLVCVTAYVRFLLDRL
jgi:hypothetical protein